MLRRAGAWSDVFGMMSRTRRYLAAACAGLGLAAAGGAGAAYAANSTCIGCSTTTTTPPPAPAPAPPTTTSTTTAPVRQPPAVVTGGAERLVQLANADRAAAGAPPLRLRADVTGIATTHSFAMVAQGDIFHNDDYFSAATRAALGAGVLGENVASNSSVDDAHRRLMNSPHHRANLLDPRFTVVGLGVVDDGTGYLYVTEDFVQPADAPAARTVRAAAAPRPSAPRAVHQPTAAPTDTTATSAAGPDPAPTASTAPVPTSLVPAGHRRPGPAAAGPAGILLAGAAVVLVALVTAGTSRFSSRLGGRQLTV